MTMEILPESTSSDRLPLPNWENEGLILDGSEFLSKLLRVIDGAQTSLCLEFYIFEPGMMANALFESLRRAKARGVSIRLLVDGMGAHNFVEDFEQDLDEIGLEYKVYHPAPWHFMNFKVSMAWLPSTLIQLFSSINNRNHRKVAVADNAIAIVGSFNISDVHLPKPDGDGWFDFGIVVEGDCVEFLISAFDHAWEGWLGYHRSLSRWFGIRTYVQHMKAETYFLLNHTVRLRKSISDRLHRNLKRSGNRIWISTPYFAPSWKLIRILGRAAKKGVDVRMMVPSYSDVTFMHWVMRSYYATLLKRKIRLFEYKPSVLHAKILIADDWMLIGSSNMNSRSLFHDLEANYLLQMSSTKHQLVKFMSHRFDVDCQEIVDAKAVSWIESLLGRFALLFKYWI